jgi:hypothetical protein
LLRSNNHVNEKAKTTLFNCHKASIGTIQAYRLIHFFNRFIGRKLALVEFWIRFDTSLKCQRQEELMDDNTSQYTDPTLFTSWEIEKHGVVVYTLEV